MANITNETIPSDKMQQPPKIAVPPQFANTVPGTIQAPAVPVLPKVAQPIVPKPAPLLASNIPATNQPAVPLSQVPKVQVPVVKPQIPAMQVPNPQVPTAQVTMPQVPKPQVTMPQVPKVVVAQPTMTPKTQGVQPATRSTTQQGGILKQLGGGIGLVTTTTIAQPTTAAPVVNIVEETGYSILIKLLDEWNGSPEKAQQLANLRYQNGNFIIDANHRNVIMEVIGMLRQQPFEEVLIFLTKARNMEYVLWDQESMDIGRSAVTREIAIQQTEEVGVKGVGRCRYCPSTEIVYATKQTRAADEPLTVFARCVMCHKQWRE